MPRKREISGMVWNNSAANRRSTVCEIRSIHFMAFSGGSHQRMLLALRQPVKPRGAARPGPSGVLSALHRLGADVGRFSSHGRATGHTVSFSP